MSRSVRVLVTGASGFVGSVLFRRLLTDGHDVHALVRPGSDRWRLDGLDAPVHDVDLADGEELGRIVSRLRPEWIFHLAAHGAYPSQQDMGRMLRANLLGTTHLVESCLRLPDGFAALVNTGSSSEYGFVDHPPAEDEPPHPNSNYAVTKLGATLYCQAAAERHRARIPTLRLYSVYGPYEEPTRLVPALAVHGLAGGLPPLVSPDVARDFVFVDDVVDAYLKVAASKADVGGEVFNVGTGIQTTIGDAVAVARKVLAIGMAPRWGSMPQRTWDTSVWVSNPEKIAREVGWRATVQFESGFRRFVEWLRENPGLWESYRTRIRR